MATQIALYFSAPPPASAGSPVIIPDSGDLKVLKYALALETLETELYRQAYTRLTGSTPDGSAPTDQFGTTISGLGVSDSDADASYLKTFSSIEADHRNYLTKALGGNWVTDAGVKFDFKINTLSRLQVIQLVYLAELTGVSAYLGAIPSLATKTYLATAAAILGTEARHTATVAIALNGPIFHSSPAIETAPLANENHGIDTPLSPDIVLYQGGSVPSGLLPQGYGSIGNVSQYIFI